MGIRSFLQRQLCGRHRNQSSPIPEQKKPKWELRDALLKCATLSESEVDAYIAYQASIVYEDVPLDYELTHPDENARLLCLYSNGILQIKTLSHHTAKISPETLEKVQRVLPLILCQGHELSS